MQYTASMWFLYQKKLSVPALIMVSFMLKPTPSFFKIKRRLSQFSDFVWSSVPIKSSSDFTIIYIFPSLTVPVYLIAVNCFIYQARVLCYLPAAQVPCPDPPDQ